MGAILFSILKAQNINATISVLLLILPLKNLAYRWILAAAQQFNNFNIIYCIRLAQNLVISDFFCIFVG